MYIREPTWRLLGQSPGPFEGAFIGSSRGDSAEVVRLADEMTKLAQRKAWTSVEKTYKQLESISKTMGDEAFDLMPNAAAIHKLGAEAACVFGDTKLFQTRLWRAKMSLDAAGVPLNDPTLRRIIDLLDAIEKAYGAVTIAPRTEPKSKKQQRQMSDQELIPVRKPSTGNELRSIEFAAKAIMDTGHFKGLLPAGDYTLANQSFTVGAGTELTGKRPTNVLWGS